MEKCKACLYSIGCIDGPDKVAGSLEFRRENVLNKLGPVLAYKAGVSKDNGCDSYINSLRSGTTIEIQVHHFQEGEKCFRSIYW